MSQAGVDSPGKPKRQRVHLNCAECRRTKSKCDRTWPCSNCKSKGLQQSCPGGVLKDEPSKRDTIHVLTRRITQLETQLSEAQHRLSTFEETSPYSESEGAILPPKAAHLSKTAHVDNAEGVKDEFSPRYMAAMLTQLSLESKRYARDQTREGAEASPFWMQSPEVSDDEEDEESADSTISRPQIRKIPGGFDYSHEMPSISHVMQSTDATKVLPTPVVPWTQTALPPPAEQEEQSSLNKYRALLPPQQVARTVFQRFWELTSWRIRPMTRSFFLYRVLPDIFHDPITTAPSNLAVMFAIMAIVSSFDGAVDISGTGASPLTGTDYQEIAYQCLVHGHFYTDITPSSLIAIHLLGTFVLNSGDRRAPDTIFSLMGLAVRLACIAGYHRDPYKSDIPLEELDVRRRIWYELLAIERVHCMPSLIPMPVKLAEFDSLFPTDVDTDDFFWWKWTLGRHMSQVVEFWTSTKVPPERVVHEIDVDVRKLLHALPDRLWCPILDRSQTFSIQAVGSTSYESKSTSTPDTFMSLLGSATPVQNVDQGLVNQQYRLAEHFCMVLFHLHRPLFMRSFSAENRNQHSLSFNTVIECCTLIIRLVEAVLQISNLSRWFSFSADLFSILHCQTALVVKTFSNDPALSIRFATLRKGVQVMEDTTTLYPNAKNRAMLIGAKKMLHRAETVHKRTLSIPAAKERSERSAISAFASENATAMMLPISRSSSGTHISDTRSAFLQTMPLVTSYHQDQIHANDANLETSSFPLSYPVAGGSLLADPMSDDLAEIFGDPMAGETSQSGGLDEFEAWMDSLTRSLQ